MQLHAHPRRFWIDSICSNQADNEEKSAQVSLMGMIYASAEYVAACLGSGVICREVMLAIEKQDGDVALNIEKELSSNQYFDRLWIKQEIILALDVNFFCGCDRLAWDQMARCLELAKSSREIAGEKTKDSSIQTPTTNIFRLYEHRMSRQLETHPTQHTLRNRLF